MADTTDLGGIGYVATEELQETRDAMAAILGGQPYRRKGFALAGPNDWITILLGSPMWIPVGWYLLQKFGDKIFDTVFDRSIEKVTGPSGTRIDDESIARLVAALKAEQQRDNTISIGIKTPTEEDRDRNWEIVLEQFDELTFARAAILLAAVSRDVEVSLEKAKGEYAVWWGGRLNKDVLESPYISGGKITLKEAADRLRALCKESDDGQP